MHQATVQFKVLVILLALLAIGITLPPSTTEATSVTSLQSLSLDNVRISVMLGTNDTSLITISGEITNTGSANLTYVDVRVDVRSVIVLNASVGSSYVSATWTSEGRYIMLRLHPPTPITTSSSTAFSVQVSTTEIQEGIGMSEDGGMYLNQAILYLRPNAVLNNLTFTVMLPEYGILSCDCSSPIFPDPIRNFTDGSKIGFLWEREQILPNQEIAFIVMYDLPVLVVENTVPVVSAETSLLLLLAGVAVGVVSLFVFQKFPTVIERLRTPMTVTGSIVSSQEELIIEFVKTRGGSCTQREIYRELDFSQSTASMILTSLEDRGLIKRLREGRENIVHIIED
ncbi:MAG: helix-turn-helix transcriptional regulator [Candidatus Thorarchaeota archaeon]|jgi:uncharacterized membrane protein